MHSTGVVFLCCQGKTERISAAVLLPLLSCLPKAPSLDSGLTLLPSVPGSLPPGAHTAFRGSWGSLGCCSHQRLFYCLAPHLKDPLRQHQLRHPSPQSMLLPGWGKGIFPRAHHDTNCSPRCPHACPWDFTQHPSLPWWAQGGGETAAALCCLSLGWEGTSLLWASPSTALAPRGDAAPSAFHPGADVRPLTVTPAPSRG